MAYRSEQDRERRRQYAKEVRDWCREHGICTRCNKERAESGEALCLVCRMKLREDSQERYRKYAASMTEEERQARNAKKRQIAAKKRAQGICHQCNRPVYQNHAYCYEHYISQRNAHRKHDKKLLKGYAEQGLCRICGGECVPGKKFCPEHYQQKVEAIKRAGEHRDLKKHTWAQDNNAAFRGKEREYAQDTDGAVETDAERMQQEVQEV